MCDYCLWIKSAVEKSKIKTKVEQTKSSVADPVIIVHGGAGKIPKVEREFMLEEVKNAAKAAYEQLIKGTDAMEAVVLAISHMETKKYFNCAKGGSLDVNGEVVMDAAIMDNNFKAGCVGAVRDIEHPIILAKTILEKTDHVLLVDKGAQKFAVSEGITILPPDWLLSCEDPPPSIQSEDYENLEIEGEYKSSEIVDKSENFEIDDKYKDFGIENMSEDFKVDDKCEDFEVDDKSEDLKVDDKSEDLKVDDKNKDLEVEDKSEDLKVDDKSEDLKVDDKNKDLEVEDKSEDLKVDDRYEDLEVDDKNKDFEVDDKYEDFEADDKYEDLKVDDKYEDIKVDDKYEDLKVDDNYEDSEVEAVDFDDSVHQSISGEISQKELAQSAIKKLSEEERTEKKSEIEEPMYLMVSAVGAIAYDQEKKFVSGTSTAGNRGKMIGSVSSIGTVLGCGIFADYSGCISVSGEDKKIYSYAPARKFVERLKKNANTESSLKEELDLFEMETNESNIGAIALNSAGEPAVIFKSMHFPWAICQKGWIHYGCAKDERFSEKIKNSEKSLDCLCKR